MRIFQVTLLAALSWAMVCQTTSAQRKKRSGRPGGERGRRSGGPGGERGRQGGFTSPLMRALDTNRDGTLSAEEIKNASKVLKSLDKNKDGKLTRDELGGDRRGGGRGGFGGGRGGGFGGQGGNRGNFAAAFIKRLMANDKNKDGKISKEEAPERMQRIFSRIDTNNDGFIDKAEIKKMTERFGNRGGGRSRGGDRKRPGGDRKRPGQRKRPKTANDK
ncbi:MAG: EF-hand domain-containing protein [Planctomycetes bacterium]|nr:EF-hand domain-containing protein [Planctomycetota bacterium]